MRHPRLLRTLFLLPILLCLAGWAWSEAHSSYAMYVHNGLWVGGGTVRGVVAAYAGADSPMGDGWNDGFILRDSTPPWHESNVLGFSFRHLDFKADAYALAIPYWFLITFFSLLFLLIYRKTRPNPHPPTAFPIEPTKTDQPIVP